MLCRVRCNVYHQQATICVHRALWGFRSTIAPIADAGATEQSQANEASKTASSSSFPPLAIIPARLTLRARLKRRLSRLRTLLTTTSPRQLLLARTKQGLFGSVLTKDLAADQGVEIFATYIARSTPAPTVPIEGWVYNLPDTHTTRIQKWQKRLTLPEGAANTWHWLLLKGARHVKVDCIIPGLAEAEKVTAVSSRNGTFSASLTLSPTINTWLQKIVSSPVNPTRLRMICPAPDGRVFSGTVFAIPDHGLSVISDIDDTIRMTDVRRKRKMVANTMLRDFVAVSGMADLFRHWHVTHHAMFHYVSTSPFQLHTPLTKFLHKTGFPPGTIQLNALGWRDARFVLQSRHANRKPQQIRAILTAFPHRRFVLVGDSAQHDPLIYATLAREFPDQIVHVFLRQVGKTRNEVKKLAWAVEMIGQDKVTVFTQLTPEMKDFTKVKLAQECRDHNQDQLKSVCQLCTRAASGLS